MAKILFSPVGGTDPISNYRDGALIHICRHYKPDIVYLYMSGEIINYHKADNRYLYVLEKLKQSINHNFEICLVEQPNLFDVHIFDKFLVEFQEILQSIMEDRKNDTLLLNISSGTPAMKGALQTLSVFLTYPMIPIQVSTPERRMNNTLENRNDYDVELQWECNEDNEEGSENRCTESLRINLQVEFQKKIIENQILTYNYQGALEVAKSIESFLPENYCNILRGALCRLQYNLKDIEKYVDFKKINLLEGIPQKYNRLYEYILNLNIKLKKEDYADNIRAITPYFYEILMMIVKEQLKIDLAKATDDKRRKAGVYYWRTGKLERNYPEVYKVLNDKEKGGLKDSHIFSRHLIYIIEEFSDDEDLIKNILFIRKVEEEIRNAAAHRLSDIGKEMKGISMKEVLEKLKTISVKAGLTALSKSWNSYEIMNEKLINRLNR